MPKSPPTPEPKGPVSEHRAVDWRDCHVVTHPGYGLRLGLVLLPKDPPPELTRVETDAEGAPVIVEVLRAATEQDWAVARGRYTDLTQKD